MLPVESVLDFGVLDGARGVVGVDGDIMKLHEHPPKRVNLVNSQGDVRTAPPFWSVHQTT